MAWEGWEGTRIVALAMAARRNASFIRLIISISSAYVPSTYIYVLFGGMGIWFKYITAICSDRVWGALSMCVTLPYRLSMVTSWCGNDAFLIVTRIHRSLDGSTRKGLSLQGFGIIFNVNFISCWANSLRAIDFRRRACDAMVITYFPNKDIWFK